MLLALTQGKVALISTIDFPISQYKWCVDGKYASTTIKGKKVLMHRLIMNVPESMEVDHIDGNGLNNRRSNLRVCTRSQNGKNRKLAKNNKSGYHGVHFANTEKRKKRWVASIRVNGIKRVIGRFYTPLEAAHAYNRVALQNHKEFASLNKV